MNAEYRPGRSMSRSAGDLRPADSSPPLPGQMRPARRILLLWAVTCFAVVSLSIASLWTLRQQALRHAQESVSDLAALLHEQTANAMHAVDATLHGIADRLRADHATGYLMDELAIHTLLRARADGMPELRSLSIFGADGALVHTSLAYPAPELSVADRAFYIVHRHNTGSGLFIDRPHFSALHAAWVIPVSHRLDGLDSGFEGVIAAALDPDHFATLYRSIDLGEGGSIGLFHRDGTLLASWPHRDTVPGASFSDTPVFRALAAGEEAIDQAQVLFEAGEINAFMQTNHLIVSVTMSAATILQRWRNQSLFTALTVTLIVLLLGLASVGLADRLRREEALRAELRQSHRDLRNLAASLQEVRETEQGRIARELHDELGQYLDTAGRDARWLSDALPADRPELRRRAEAVQQLIDAAVVSMDRITTELRPETLEDRELADGLKHLVETFSSRTGIAISMELDLGGTHPDQTRARAIFRIIQEALTNVARHARASKVLIQLSRATDCLHLVVQDDGEGMGDSPAITGQGLGLLGIHERAVILGGDVTIDSRPGGGTLIGVRLPDADGPDSRAS